MGAYPFSYMQIANAQLIESMHRQFLQDPQSVEASWRYFFEGMAFGSEQPAIEQGDVRTLYLIDAYRRFGHLKAHTNPLGSVADPEELQLARFGFSESDLHKIVPTFGVLEKEAPLAHLIERLEQIYCGTVAIEYMNCSQEVRDWVQKRIEGESPRLSIEQKQRVLHFLNRAEVFELFLHTKYVGQKRFSLEGGESLIPLLAEVVDEGGRLGVEEMIIGMAHRGRLNVLANLLNKSYAMIFTEFEDFYDPKEVGGDGDVKYHKGFSADVTNRYGNALHISVTANPSHLESVDAVALGKTYAKQVALGDREKTKVLPLLIHGDASVSGQGIVYETMQLGRLEGYGTGGTLHIVIDNQVGFTTVANEYRSTRYSTDLAHAFEVPVLHVDGDDPEGCVHAAKLAIQIRQHFHCDVFINLICYRKYGHNESDDPAFTQPQQYQVIRSKQSVRELYRESLVSQGILEQQMATRLEEEFRQLLQKELETTTQQKQKAPDEAFAGTWADYHEIEAKQLFEPVATAVSEKILKHIGRGLSQVSSGFTLHPKLVRFLEERVKKLDSGIDWALAEALAMGSLLVENFSVRLSGQDSQRGTFTQRHAVFVDQKTQEHYCPLAHLQEKQGLFEVYNSALSEFGVLGFEFGYSLAAPKTLVLWEAQFGDFANGAQVIIDQYVVASVQKWSRFSGLVLLLPHGYEGQGAEHSSARLERFLQLAAEQNIQVVYPTTPAQYFHLLRRQMVRPLRLPLIVMTPKGLLRHPRCVSSLHECATSTFQEILVDEPQTTPSRLLLCSGRIYYDLVAEKERLHAEDVTLIRFEQLYPLNMEHITQLLSRYKEVQRVYWVQEEPQNMGAWHYIEPILRPLCPLSYIGRKRSAATATASHAMHAQEQERIIKQAFNQ